MMTTTAVTPALDFPQPGDKLQGSDGFRSRSTTEPSGELGPRFLLA
jgi:hypothetical protein